MTAELGSCDKIIAIASLDSLRRNGIIIKRVTDTPYVANQVSFSGGSQDPAEPRDTLRDRRFVDAACRPDFVFQLIAGENSTGVSDEEF